MSLLTPLFLVALGALAIPIFLHLIQKERRNVVLFPSLMFLKRIPYQSVQRRRIRHWLLLMLRLGALVLIVLAFARPFLRRTDAAAAGGSGAREVVVLLDRSYSMGFGDRWTRALGAARQALEGLGSSDRGSVVLFASSAEVALRSTADSGRLQAALAGIEPSAAATRYGPALKLAGSIVGESALPRREVILISDFQRVGWQGAEGVRLPDGVVLTPVSVADGQSANLAVTPVALQRGFFQDQERVTITSGAINHGDEAVQQAEVSLEVAGRTIQTKRLDVDARGSTSVTFDPLTVSEPNLRATVRLGNDALACDNAFHLVLSPQEPVRLVIAERPGAPRESSLYLSRALAVGESPRFEATLRQADAVSAGDLEASAVVVLNDVPVPPGLADRLQRFVEAGGGLLVVAANRTTWPASVDILPGLPDAPTDRTTGRPARLGALEYGHPVFEIFRAPRSGDFSAAQVYGYRALKPVAGSRVLARYDDGAPALLERRVGNGRVLLWTSSLDLFWNDLALKPVFLPFVHRMVRHLGAYREPRPWRTVGDVVEPHASATPSPTPVQRVVLTPGGQRLPLDEEGADVLELTEQGFYEVRTTGRESEPPVIVASNVDLAESDLTGMDPKEIVAAAMGRAGAAAGADMAPPTDESQESAQRMWWYLLFAAALLLGAETLVANRSAV
ncbi:MAG TPA: BatA domain-containing protein [Vicinamibacterales bacterium]|nr:BatA domain-containing protein [Vicinamibacterales bacterium]